MNVNKHDKHGHMKKACEKVKDLFGTMENLAKEHCKFKTYNSNECKEYCEKYCDHFAKRISEHINDYYSPSCPNDDNHYVSNNTEEILQTDKGLDDYFNRFINNENCRES